MVYFVKEGEILTDAKVMASSVILFARKEGTGEIEKESLAVLPKHTVYHGVYDMKDVIGPSEGYYFPEEEQYLIRIEGDVYPRFAVVGEGQFPSTFRLLSREELVNRITRARQSREIIEALKELGYTVVSWKSELFKALGMLVVSIVLGFTLSHHFSVESEEIGKKLGDLSFQKKQLDRLYDRYRDRLYVIKEKTGKEGVEFLEKVEKLPLSRVESVLYANRWIVNGVVPYWNVKKLKEACRKEGLTCTLNYRGGGEFDVKIVR